MSGVTSEARNLDHVSHTGSARVRTSAVSTSKFGLRVLILRECSRKTLSHFFVCRLVDDCECEQEKMKKSLKVVLEILNHSNLGRSHNDFGASATVIVNGQSRFESTI